jgi:hypothetical protein
LRINNAAKKHGAFPLEVNFLLSVYEVPFPSKMQSAVDRQLSPLLATHSPNRTGSISFKAYLKENALCSEPISNRCHAPASILVE